MSGEFFKNEEINSKIKEHLNLNFEGEKFAYFIINKANLNEISIINNNQEWFDLYIKQKHQVADPVVTKSLSRLGDFTWDQWDESIIFTA
ncbi:LuxR family transcriptional regulator, quorum-sensing system regulator ExpR [Izhakiella capsodis]|uniref:LuxR family transcriptional regulator, quorum-sensing system regulator ExpR n=1 Tax=Izhakiella capsodis TaxID=1367852 RepID=A0A1I5A7E4_9GAMM|nr:autoinducer binding domain-containing protein [Izhakiella capsodis]SFN58357.1 LuxR family transcriptional regulator, quorum-sensing system regulator ExpR [Izhakiella capsodis]